MHPGKGKYRGYTSLTYQAECGHLVFSWLLELFAEETAEGYCV